MTKEQSTKLNISLIPLFILIALILGSGYLLIQGEIKLPKFNNGPQVRRLDGFPTIVYTDKKLEKQRRVLKNEEELNEFLNYVDESGLLTLRNSVDFAKEYLLAASTETEGETGHGMKVKKVYKDKDKQMFLVSLEETESGKGCDTEPDQNVAVDIVSISKTDWEIDFDRVLKVEDCEE